MNSRLTRRALPERLPPWGVAVLESYHAPDWSMEWRRHAFLKAIYALGGAGSVETDDSCVEFGPGDLVIVPQGQRNRVVDQPGEPSSLYVLCVAPAVLAFDRRLSVRFDTTRRVRSAYVADRAESLLRRLLFQQAHGGDGASIAIAAAALELLSITLGPPGGAPDEAADARDEVRRYVARLDAHFYEATSIDDAAKRLGLSRRRFTQLFREVTGKGWLAYVHERAIDHAARLLAETEAPIASVAFECGFGDLSTFYRRFKSLRGASPGEWRRRAAAAE